MNEAAQHIFAVIANNRPGILFRILELFYRREFNLDSVTACQLPDPALARMTLLVKGNNDEIEQIKHQIAKLPDVKQVLILQPDNCCETEIALYKIKYDTQTLPLLTSILVTFDARIIDAGEQSVVVKFVGNHKSILNLSKALGQFEVIEMARSGCVALAGAE